MLAEELLREPDRIAAHVAQRAALELGRQPDVAWAANQEMKIGLDLAQLADRAAGDQGPDPVHLLVEWKDEGLPEQSPSPPRHVEHSLGVGEHAAERLFAEHRLARLERADGPFRVQ